MADVFISYKSQDRERVRLLVDGFRRVGLGVWWDQDIPPAAPWEASITEALESARCVLVCWTRTAVDAAEGRQVQVEAREAQDQHKLIQVLLDDVRQPLFFRHAQAVDLSKWDGDERAPVFQRLAQAARDQVSGRTRSLAPMRQSHNQRQADWSSASPPAGSLPMSASQALWLGGAALASVIVVSIVVSMLMNGAPQSQPAQEQQVVAEQTAPSLQPSQSQTRPPSNQPGAQEAPQEAAPAPQAAEPAPQPSGPVRQLGFEERLSSIGVSITRVNDQQVLLNPNVSFTRGDEQLRPHDAQRLADLAGVLRDFRSLTIDVWGHTDSVGLESSNTQLSEQRAITVGAQLVANGVDRNLILARAFGESRPVADNGTQSGRAMNNRVEIFLSGRW